ncbi:hypothetical protein HOE22_07155 [Candidatus Woesearchaeota archaeon]|jgi:hypothetical protein|nr:hypothetical protein [Candidatus Woesearchaeota archaeon]MBT7555317.1 hypothetical protein [Candidatus Woesearchaeota archaeon]
MNRMRVTLRFYLPDFIENLNTNIEQLEKIYKKSLAPITLYLWYDTDDKKDLGQLKEFIKNWESRQHFRTVIRTSFVNSPKDFIWFDIIPYTYENKTGYNSRFSYSYIDKSKIVDGIKHFDEILSFTTGPKPKKIQKRTDHNYNESGDSR